MRFDSKTAGRIAAGEITALIYAPERPKLGGHIVQFERKRTWEDGPNPRGEETIWQTRCRISITDCVEKRLGVVTYEESKAAGFANLDLFRAWWVERFEWDDLVPVFVARLEVVAESPDPVRLLARGGGYTTSPALAIDELEAVSSSAQELFTKESRLFDHMREQQRREGWEKRSTVDRLAAVRAEAVARNIDISHHERVIADRLDRIERLLGKDKAA